MEDIREKIVNLIPSKALKSEMAKRQTVLKDRDLIALIYQHAPTIKESFELLQRLKPFVKSDKDVKLIENITKLRNTQIKRFTSLTKNCVYQVEIVCNSGSKDTFFNKRFDTIIDNLRYWLQFYSDVMDGDGIRNIVVTKKHVFDYMDDKSLEKANQWEYCHLTPEFEISKISVGKYSKLEDMLDGYRIHWPAFINKYDLVSYVYDGVKYYGIVTVDMKSVSFKEDIAVYELDQPIATYHRFFDETTLYKNDVCYDFFNKHEHIKLTDPEKENIESVPAQIQSNYLYIKECLTKI